MSLAENIDGHFNANDLRPPSRAQKLSSKTASQVTAIHKADGSLTSVHPQKYVRTLLVDLLKRTPLEGWCCNQPRGVRSLSVTDHLTFLLLSSLLFPLFPQGVCFLCHPPSSFFTFFFFVMFFHLFIFGNVKFFF